MPFKPKKIYYIQNTSNSTKFVNMPDSSLKTTAAITPVVPFDAKADAIVLRKAMKGFGTNEKAIINIITKRTNFQRYKIEDAYQILYERDLIKDFKKELSGNFLALILALMTRPYDFIAEELKEAGLKGNEETLIEILCGDWTNFGEEQLFEKYLEDMKVTGEFKHLLKSLANAKLDDCDSEKICSYEAVKDARALYESEEKGWGIYERQFNEILVSCGYCQIQRIFYEYKDLSGHDIEVAIQNEFSGSIAKGLCEIVKFIKSKENYFAEKLYKSMHGFGTDIRTLIRIIVSRSEIDLLAIKDAFEKMYGKSLKSYISGDTSGDFKTALISIISP